MPPFAVAIPVISRSEQNRYAEVVNPKPMKKSAAKTRMYDEGPLPTRPSTKSPKQARIIDRDYDTYHLRIGDVDIPNVSIEEILDYVSPLDLEEFENRVFAGERSTLALLEAEKAQAKRENLERQKERSKRKGVVIFEEVDSTEEATEDGEAAVGKHGRARPTYTQFYKRPEEPKMRQRNTDTDGMISLDEDDTADVSTENEAIARASAHPPDLSSALPKRRRRKRDKVTGELLPLSPIALADEAEHANKQKRQRRRRHPITNELMPVGWRYDPEKDLDHRPERDSARSFRQLSISEEPLVKRQRLDLKSSVSRSPSPLPSKTQLAAQHGPTRSSTNATQKASQAQKQRVVLDIVSSDDDSSVDVAPAASTNIKSPVKSVTATPKSFKKRPIDLSSAQESSPEPVGRTPIPQTSSAKSQTPKRAEGAKTSILNPSFSRTSSTEPPEDDDISEDEWVVEAILDHELSNPDTHPTEFGTDPVMLYLVKWEGYDELTYEPFESFGDPLIVAAYRKQAGLDKESDDDVTMAVTAPMKPPSNVPLTEQQSAMDHDESGEDSDEDEMDNEEFEVESILSHHLSDPRTHPPELGRTPVVLYRVKWRGYDEPTFEPASSFADKSVLQQYHDRSGR